jgi:hypothetical protein
LQNITIVFLTSVTEETEEKRSGGLYEKAVWQKWFAGKDRKKIIKYKFNGVKLWH